ncbi:hypothetical protein BDW59DRAFT_137312 [Aspergillus cavernicola]|uniref:Secreted protein n=1 Tax=Aspergillus cavernicola TaxID=176166 RepID=A0ABR4J6L2_9EURO
MVLALFLSLLVSFFFTRVFAPGPPCNYSTRTWQNWHIDQQVTGRDCSGKLVDRSRQRRTSLQACCLLGLTVWR